MSLRKQKQIKWKIYFWVVSWSKWKCLNLGMFCTKILRSYVHTWTLQNLVTVFVDSSFAERIETMVFSKNQYILPRFSLSIFFFYAKMHCRCIDNERYRLNDCILSHNSQERDWLYQRRHLKNSAESSLNEVIQWGNHCYNN